MIIFNYSEKLAFLLKIGFSEQELLRTLDRNGCEKGARIFLIFTFLFNFKTQLSSSLKKSDNELSQLPESFREISDSLSDPISELYSVMSRSLSLIPLLF